MIANIGNRMPAGVMQLLWHRSITIALRIGKHFLGNLKIDVVSMCCQEQPIEVDIFWDCSYSENAFSPVG
jgi:hypothetical protein